MRRTDDEYELGLAYVNGLHPIAAEELISRQFDPPDYILTPWLTTQGLTMIYASCGIGKTFVAIGIAVAVASGLKIFNWNAPKPRRVLIIDGEMGTFIQEG